MKEGWELKKLGDYFDITSSKRVFKADWRHEGVPFYRAREIIKLAKNGFVENELFISEEMFNFYSKKYGIPKEGDLMVTGVGTLGISYVVKKNDKFYFKDGNIIWLKKTNEIDSHFVEFAFKSDFIRNQIDDNIGATVGTYTIIKAKNTKIPVPPLSEQQRIVEILDKTFAKIDTVKQNAERNLENVKKLFQSLLNEYYNHSKFKVFKLGNIARIIGGGTPSKANESFYKGEIPWATVRDMNVDFLRRTEYSITKEALSKCSTNLIQKKNIIIASRVGLGKVCILEQDTAINQDIRGIIPLKDNILIKYLFWWFKNKSNYIISNGKGATVHGVNLNFIKNLEIPLPPLEEQKRIVSKLDTLSEYCKEVEENYRKVINFCNEIKSAILAKAFNGEL